MYSRISSTASQAASWPSERKRSTSRLARMYAVMSRTKAVRSTTSTVLMRTTDAVMTQEMKRPLPRVEATARSKSTVPPVSSIIEIENIGKNDNGECNSIDGDACAVPFTGNSAAAADGMVALSAVLADANGLLVLCPAIAATCAAAADAACSAALADAFLALCKHFSQES